MASEPSWPVHGAEPAAIVRLLVVEPIGDLELVS